MKNKIIPLFLVCLTACSAQQPIPVLSAPSVVNVDAGPPVYIDRDAYSIHLSDATQGIALAISDGSGPNGERLTPLRTGQPAPFNGVLLNGPAVARVDVEFRGQQTQCLINRQADVDRVTAMAIRDIEALTNSLDSQRRAYELMIRSRDSEITRLYDYSRNRNQPVNVWPYVAIGLGGLALGIGATATIIILSR